MTFATFVTFGSIPILPFVLLNGGTAFPVSIVATALATALVGGLGWAVMDRTLATCLAETLAIGALCNGVAWGAGHLVAGPGQGLSARRSQSPAAYPPGGSRCGQNLRSGGDRPLLPPRRAA